MCKARFHLRPARRVSHIAAGTAYSNHGINTIPFFIFYSMFGMQRVGDMVWAAGDSRAKGFILGATSGRSTLAGEGLQHQDGNSHILALPVPNLLTYDPSFAFELAIIIEDGLRRMYADNEDVFYYLTLMNENYPQPRMPEGVREGVLKGMYRFREAPRRKDPQPTVQLLGSGAILNEAIKAADLLAERYGVAADVWSVPSYKMLYRDAIDTERWNALHPGAEPRLPYVTTCLADTAGPIVAATDYIKALPLCVARWMPRPVTPLGTDGFGRSDGRDALRRFFEIDAAHIALAALSALARDGQIDAKIAAGAVKDLQIDNERPNPLVC